MELDELLAEREIYRQLVRFARAMDACDWKAFGTLCTEDIESDFGLGAQTGRDVMVEHMRRYLDVCGPTQHMLGNVLIDVTGDLAHSEAYVADMHLGAGEKNDLTFRTLGIYNDDWKKVDGRWLMCRRIKDNRATIGSMDVFTPG